MSKIRSEIKQKFNRFGVTASMHWIRGSMYMIVVLFGWYFIKPVVPSLMELTGNRNEFVAVVLFVIFGPLVVGWLGVKVLNPLVRNWVNVGGLNQWEDRIVQELSPDDSHGFPVVLAPWPSAEVRSLALLTNIYQAADGGAELASVFIPDPPNPTHGTLRVVRIDKLIYTDWTFKDLLQNHVSYGSSGPELFADTQESDFGSE